MLDWEVVQPMPSEYQQNCFFLLVQVTTVFHTPRLVMDFNKWELFALLKHINMLA